MLTASCNSGNRDNDNSDVNYTTSSKAMRLGVIPVDECLPVYVAEHLGLLDSLHADVKLIHLNIELIIYIIVKFIITLSIYTDTSALMCGHGS